MDTPQAYATEPTRARASSARQAEPPLFRLRRAVISRGWRSLRAWVADQGDARLRYGTVRMTVERWAEREDLPQGAIGRLIAERLRADLGDDLCPIWPSACKGVRP